MLNFSIIIKKVQFYNYFKNLNIFYGHIAHIYLYIDLLIFIHL